MNAKTTSFTFTYRKDSNLGTEWIAIVVFSLKLRLSMTIIKNLNCRMGKNIIVHSS